MRNDHVRELPNVLPDLHVMFLAHALNPASSYSRDVPEGPHCVYPYSVTLGTDGSHLRLGAYGHAGGRVPEAGHGERDEEVSAEVGNGRP